MRNASRRDGGFTLIEVLIAVGVFAIALAATLSMQTASLRSTTEGRLSQEATALARSTVERLRAAAAADFINFASADHCGTSRGYTVSCTATPCAVSGGSLSCGGSPSPVAAYKVALNVTRSGVSLMQFQTVIAR